MDRRLFIFGQTAFATRKCLQIIYQISPNKNSQISKRMSRSRRGRGNGRGPAGSGGTGFGKSEAGPICIAADRALTSSTGGGPGSGPLAPLVASSREGAAGTPRGGVSVAVSKTGSTHRVCTSEKHKTGFSSGVSVSASPGRKSSSPTLTLYEGAVGDPTALTGPRGDSLAAHLGTVSPSPMRPQQALSTGVAGAGSPGENLVGGGAFMYMVRGFETIGSYMLMDQITLEGSPGPDGVHAGFPAPAPEEVLVNYQYSRAKRGGKTSTGLLNKFLVFTLIICKN